MRSKGTVEAYVKIVVFQFEVSVIIIEVITIIVYCFIGISTCPEIVG